MPSDKLDLNVGLLLAAIESQGNPPLESLSPAEARILAADGLEPADPAAPVRQSSPSIVVAGGL